MSEIRITIKTIASAPRLIRYRFKILTDCFSSFDISFAVLSSLVFIAWISAAILSSVAFASWASAGFSPEAVLELGDGTALVAPTGYC